MFRMWPLALLTGWLHLQGFLIRKGMGIVPEHEKVSVIMGDSINKVAVSRGFHCSFQKIT